MTDARSIFRRPIILDAREHAVYAGVEDNVHHYEVTLIHDGRQVTAVKGSAV